ncbi:hypothetical protein WA026_000267 [Henosepilachna vigintioctopunctata]|uniref:DDE Tnp4 domain-containing protein n=1 Tax=Henosepilachna vigintioctopunctata TaxID=420089 RepID=A0AAW1V4L1_9CUCU
MDPHKTACIAIILALATKRRVKRKRWMKEWLKKREEYSHILLLNEIRDTEPEDYKNYFRMNDITFDKLLKLVTPFLLRKNTNMRQCLPVKERLAVTLRYLATGRNFEDLKFSAVMSPSSVSAAIIETCEVLIYVLQDYLKFPTTSEEWTEIAQEFGDRYQFWNTLGAIDGKHIAIKKPANSGSLYYNYKGFFSIVLLALVNAKKEFIMVDAGMNGRISDGGVLYYSKFGALLQQEVLNIPEPASLPKITERFPYVFIGDEAFALRSNLMKPYSQKALTPERFEFNKRLSRARVVVENAFGILAARFAVFQKPINLDPQKSASVTMACCYLHNFLAKETQQPYLSTEITEYDLVNLQSTLIRNCGTDAKTTRERFCNYYNTEGKL